MIYLMKLLSSLKKDLGVLEIEKYLVEVFQWNWRKHLGLDCISSKYSKQICCWFLKRFTNLKRGREEDTFTFHESKEHLCKNYLVVEHCEKFAGPMYMKYTISFVNSMFKQIWIMTFSMTQQHYGFRVSQPL